ncbi:acetyltransferase-like isoleucine patch superfamily enzyme [Phyllobacterium trifolii]|uniref:Acetyltransferase-like isoleucine patch superfamily enzyme n=1 Tax=Phyllobacterium trifolii TaxID=300193 RepID=A0A839UFG5_9HYPH|nr:acyltransferase [Phyllobacterium trifolii]MBB3149756.1 acetyltransferase-like isoleucine patch superfamily enzyme [Phyllobacterium trifolii]
MDEMSLKVAEGNIFTIGERVATQRAVIDIKGVGNRIEIEDDCVIKGSKLTVTSDNNTIILRRGVRFKGAIIQKISPNNLVEIGEDSTFGHANFIAGEGTSIRVGARCMFSWGIEIRSTDSHAIFDHQNLRINSAADITVGSDVWVGAKSTILKGSFIPNGCVVAIASVVTKRFEKENAILAGAPARIIREGVRWERTLLG